MAEGRRVVYESPNDLESGSFAAKEPILSDFGWNGCTLRESLNEKFELRNAARQHHTVSLQLDGPMNLAFIEEGEARTRTVRPGEIYTLPARSLLSVQGRGEGSTISVLLKEKLFAVSQAQLGIANLSSLKFVAGVDDPLARELMLALREEARKGRIANENYADGLAGTLASHLIQHYGQTGAPTLSRGPGLTKAQLRNVIEFIHGNLEKRVSLAELARCANLSVYHFARLFKQSTGFSPHEYVNRLRVERAKELLLKEPNANTATVAKQVGFCDQSHLGRHFRRVAGISPREFMRSSSPVPVSSR